MLSSLKIKSQKESAKDLGKYIEEEQIIKNGYCFDCNSKIENHYKRCYHCNLFHKNFYKN